MNSGSDYFYRARTYNANAGYFTSNDPLRMIAGDFNLNRFVGNTPINSIDPFGTLEISLYGILHAPLTILTPLVIFAVDTGAGVSLTFGLIGYYLIFKTFESAGRGAPTEASDFVNSNPLENPLNPFQYNPDAALRLANELNERTLEELRSRGIGD